MGYISCEVFPGVSNYLQGLVKHVSVKGPFICFWFHGVKGGAL